jgi:hypothetical protein
MGGKRVKVTVTLTNANGSTSASANSNDIALRPVEPPPEAGPNPTYPIDPFPQPNVAKSLGKVKLKKNSITLSRLKLLCGASATGDCTGTITFTTAKAKKAGKTIKPVKHIVKLRIRPGKTLPQTFKLSSSMLKAIKAAKSLKTSVVIQLGAPGFSTKTVATGVTVSLK